MIGKVINYRYEILEKCGDGNFFSVYKARDKVLNRIVAVKVLIPQYSQNKEFAERIIGETQMLVDLNHPNIAKVFEADANNGVYFAVVEYVRGINLKERIRRTAPFSVSYAVDIAVAAAEALDHAHRNGIVHGDIRPHNILTSPEGQVKLTDFGTGRTLAVFPAIREATLLRSVHYMAPEVIRGDAATQLSDIYSLGVVLYEMLTGSVPYDGQTSAAIVAKQLSDPVPSPKTMNAGVPSLLNDIVMKAMQKDPAERYKNTAEFVAELSKVKGWLRTGESPSWPPERTSAVEEEEYIEDEERSENVLKNALMSLLAVLGVATLAAIIVVWKMGGLHSNSLPVPDLIGKTVEQAQAIADKTGLQIEEYKQEYNNNVPEGQIWMSTPAAGESVPKDRPIVRVWVSKGKEQNEVPRLIGMNADDARRKIIDEGFVVGQTESEYSDTVPSEHIIRQTPASGIRQEPSKPVDVVVSLGPDPTKIPPDSMDGSSATTDNSGTDNTADSNDNATVQEYTVDIEVPSSARDPQTVKIVVIDDTGENVAYEDTNQPGETLIKSVSGMGDKVEIKGYVANKLVRDIVYSGNKIMRDRTIGKTQ